MTEAELRTEIARAMGVGARARYVTDGDLEELLALLPPLPVLAWCAANPEAAKGLASSEMVAVPKEPTARMCAAAIEIDDVWRTERTKSPGDAYRAMLAASPPAPSGEAQGGSAPGDSDGTYEVGA